MGLADRKKGIDASLNINEIKEWRQQQIAVVSTNHKKLNEFHDEVYKETVQLAIDEMQSEKGTAPAPFAFFLMGSAGRFEQSVWSDQDHGIIFDGGENCQPYFLALGEKITNALYSVGYELCDGKVMSLNPKWCRSIRSWEIQVTDWLNEADWQSLRHFSTFFDSRVLIGDVDYLSPLKNRAFQIMEQNLTLYQRLMDNVGFMKKGIGVFGQLLPEPHGEMAGSIRLKQQCFYPYVNSLRLLALKNKMTVPSTLSRFDELPKSYSSIKKYKADFMRLLDFRLHFRKEASNYSEVHLLPLSILTKQDKKELKNLMKQGYSLFSETNELLENKT
ncbi:DUF294 nucleotidyltransferase-like domain-containing protein [Aquibacillus kalidii]|uniref:DUF294 nucleotidyltransferase-like domain-containing protein n=1 Tax=Aquibacillus kalidii TaxID=2762597 RepID=UPI00164603BF|nr:DUF294 nucleotidyltransferase-like domain-containing protein [Aquibacillus kalidii]